MKRTHVSLKERVLVVDDHAAARRSVSVVLSQAGYGVESCASAVEALARLEAMPFDTVVTDLQMPGMSGLEFIREISKRRYGAQVLMMTAHASVATAVEAMRLGAFDYLEKPFDANQIEAAVAQSLARGRLLKNDSPAFLSDDPNGVPLIGSSNVMRRLRERLARVAATDETVLVGGESGVGKELVARAIHALSERREKPLVGVNCPVLSEQLAESELFGHERGAFTGAEIDRVGRFEACRGGSIFLDEVSEISVQLQAKLLRVLQERVFERVGSSESQPLDARILAATHRDLEEEVRSGRFREDLFYRLAVVPITTPPLRERGEDIVELAEHFLQRAGDRLGRRCELAEGTRELFLEHSWPGNVRELQNIVTRACVLTETLEIQPDLVRSWLGSEGPSIPNQEGCVPMSGVTLAEMERRLIVETLERHDGHRAKTAKALGIGVRTLSGKLRDYGLPPRKKHFDKAA